MNKKTFKGQYCAQGDLNIFKVKNIPDGLKNAEKKGNQFVLAHSETGHNHVVDDSNVTVLDDPNNEFVSFMKVALGGADVTHMRSFDTHETIHLPEGLYRISRQREYTPEGYRRAAD